MSYMDFLNRGNKRPNWSAVPASVAKQRQEAHQRNDMYTVGGYSFTLDSLITASEVYTGKQRPDKHVTPELYEEAHKKLLEVKGIKQMSTKTFKGLFEEIRNVYRNARVRALQLEEAYKEAESDYKSGMKSLDGNKRLYAQADWQRAVERHNTDIMELEDLTAVKIDQLKAQFDKMCDLHFAISPSKLDTNTMELLKTGAMNLEDLRNLANEHKDNITMLKIIGKYCEDMKTPDSRTLAHNINDITNGHNYKQALQKITTIGVKAYAGGIEAKTYDKLFEETAQNVIDSMPSVEIDIKDGE